MPPVIYVVWAMLPPVIYVVWAMLSPVIYVVWAMLVRQEKNLNCCHTALLEVEGGVRARSPKHFSVSLIKQNI